MKYESPINNKLRPRLQLLWQTDEWTGKWYLMSNCFCKEGVGQNYFLKFLVVTKQIYNYVKISPKSNLMHYMYSHVCKKKKKNSSKFQSYRKGIISHWKSSNTHWKTKQGLKISFYISPYALLVAVQSSENLIRLDWMVTRGCIIQSTDSIIASHALVFILLTYDEIKRDENYSGNGLGLRRWPDFGCQHKSATHPDFFCVYLTRAKPQSKSSMFDI